MRTRPDFSKSVYDLLVVGGGINGAGIANIAAAQGLKVALVEKGDFASGASSKSTKLVHGGLRYLEHMEFDLVAESLKERFIQVKSVPHLVKPLAFIIPVYKSDPRPLWMMKLGVFLYDFLSGTYCIERHRGLTVKEVLGFIPGIQKEGLTGGVMYYDGQMDDARVCLENVLSAREKGADVANYVEVRAFLKENKRIVGVHARDALTGQEFEIRASKIVCAAGPWTNQMIRLDKSDAKSRVRTTKGIHIVYKKRISDKALLLQVKKDKRIFFVIPWGDHSIIGTTDTDYAGNLDSVETTEEDIEYLFKEARRVFPGMSFSANEIVSTFAGLRPLVYRKGHPSRLSRNHVVEESRSGAVYIMGGKYTTYRKMALDTLAVAFKKKIEMPTEMFPLYGSGEIKESADSISVRYRVDSVTIEYLKAKYGVRYLDVLKLTENDPRLREKICSCSPAILAQIVYSIQKEMAVTAEDVVWRRLGLGYLSCETKHCRRVIEMYISE